MKTIGDEVVGYAFGAETRAAMVLRRVLPRLSGRAERGGTTPSVAGCVAKSAPRHRGLAGYLLQKQRFRDGGVVGFPLLPRECPRGAGARRERVIQARIER